MKTINRSDFFYELPEELIAQTPAEPRTASRMLFMDRRTGERKHTHFSNIGDFLRPGDLLVLNDSRVLPARLYGEKQDTGTKVEVLLLAPLGGDVWEAAVKPGRRIKEGTALSLGGGRLTAVCEGTINDSNRRLRFVTPDFMSVLYEVGEMPLPHYIKAPLEDKERYQTVYSRETGSAAAPTAGLHFTKELLADLGDMGIGTAYVTLHVGLGTFRPVKADRIEEHKMHSEWYSLPQETADRIIKTKQSGGRVIAVGTTAMRTLETAAKSGIRACSGQTDIFITPGYEFLCADGLLTNFHLPESTLIMLVSAFAGYDNTMNAYREAVIRRYRFFSFGDCMLIL